MNELIIKWFNLLIKQLDFYVDIKKGKEKLIYSYKLNSIRKILEVIKNVDFEIKSGQQLKNYESVGKGGIRRIDEIIETGRLAEVDEDKISGKHLEYVDELIKIFGIGRVKAYELYTKYGIKSINDLKEAVKQGTVALPDNILKGIAYVDMIKTKIPRSEMDKVYSYLIRVGIELDGDMDVRMCGSYRRERETSNDIDVIISHPDILTKSQAEKSDLMKRFIKLLENKKFIVESFTSDDVMTKYMGICRLSEKHAIRRIDIRYIAEESYHTAILYFTGSGDFNRRMRSVALSMGYTLNEYNLLDQNKKPLPIKSEHDVFKYLNMEYTFPKERV